MLPDGAYKVKTLNYEFILRITTADNLVQVQYGDPTNQEGPCMELSYDTNMPTKIELENMMYVSRCSVDEHLQKGSGTVEMMRSMIAICKLLMPSAKRMYFKDASEFPCNDQRMFLAHYSLLLHGQTWYERHFQAVMKNKAYRERLDVFRHLLKSKPKEGIFTVNKRLIQKHSTWQELFQDLYQSQGCAALVEIQDQIFKVARVKLYYSEWYIPVLHSQKEDFPIEIKKVCFKNGMDGGRTDRTGKMRFTEEDLR